MRRRGFSLFEVSLAVALGGLLMSLLALLGPGLLRSWGRCERQSEVQRSALLCLLQLRSELSQGYGPSLQCPSPSQLCFASRLDVYGVQQYSAACEPLWQKWVSFRWDGATRQVLRRYDPWPQPEPRVVSLLYAPSSAPWERKVADHVSEFLVSSQPPLLHLSITVERQGERASLQSSLAGLGEDSD